MKAHEPLGRRLRRVNRYVLLAGMGLLALGAIAASFALGLLNLYDSSRVQTRVLGENLSAAMLFRDRPGAHDVLQSVRFAPEIASATLTDLEGNVFSEWRRDGRSGARSPMSAGEDLMERMNAITVSQPVLTSAGSSLLGRLSLSIELTSLYVRTGVLALITFVTLLVALAISELWLRRLNASILRPLQSLSALMQRISAGSGYDQRVEDAEIAELQELGQGFNAMLSAIGERDERLAAQRDSLERLAFSDNLTGLPNRKAFQDLLGRELERAAHLGDRLAILFFDLDGFKDINDSLGHLTGDRLLQSAADRLRRIAGQTGEPPAHEVFRYGVDLARLGGDEFVALLVSPGSREALEASHCIAEYLRLPFDIEGRELRLTTSIGIAMYPDDGGDVDTLLKHADTAMYHAKAQGRDNAQFYHSTLTQQAIDRMTLERDLRVALEQSQFHLAYQPQLNTRTGRIESVEALIRWTHPERGAISPVDFIPVAERNGLIVPIGDFVLRTACEAAMAWHRAGFPLRVAVNLSAVQLHTPGLVELVAETLQDTGLPAEFLELEMTESALIEHTEETRERLRALRATGLRLALDDFGTGYSSMSYLHRMPLHSIKMDRSFVQGLTHNSDNGSIVRAMLSMAHSLGLEVTAEGVETAEQALLLTEMRCQALQGWYIGRPMPAERIAQLAERQRDNELHTLTRMPAVVL